MSFRLLSTLVCAGLLLGGGLLGCSDRTGLGVAQGRYRLYVEGSLSDTLTGPAVLHRRRNGRVGLELGQRDGPGMSIALVSAPPSRRKAGGGPAQPPLQPGRYDVVAASLLDGAPTERPAGLAAFLSVGDRAFVATRGHLSVREEGEGRVRGRLDLVMTERGGALPAERTVRVTGAFRATAP